MQNLPFSYKSSPKESFGQTCLDRRITITTIPSIAEVFSTRSRIKDVIGKNHPFKAKNANIHVGFTKVILGEMIYVYYSWVSFRL